MLPQDGAVRDNEDSSVRTDPDCAGPEYDRERHGLGRHPRQWRHHASSTTLVAPEQAPPIALSSNFAHVGLGRSEDFLSVWLHIA